MVTVPRNITSWHLSAGTVAAVVVPISVEDRRRIYMEAEITPTVQYWIVEGLRILRVLRNSDSAFQILTWSLGILMQTGDELNMRGLTRCYSLRTNIELLLTP